MEPSHIQQNLYWYLLRVAISSKHVLMKIMEKHDLTVMQFYTLCVLDDDTSVPMSSLSNLLYCDASNVTGIVDRLFTRQLIKREENPRDRRVKMITLTPKGAEICQRIFGELALLQPTELDNLSEDEKEQLSSLLQKILQPALVEV